MSFLAWKIQLSLFTNREIAKNLDEIFKLEEIDRILIGSWDLFQQSKS
jgi:2-keto-3-deoxy-L-rhamnonate aldolase RhmA